MGNFALKSCTEESNRSSALESRYRNVIVMESSRPVRCLRLSTEPVFFTLPVCAPPVGGRLSVGISRRGLVGTCASATNEEAKKAKSNVMKIIFLFKCKVSGKLVIRPT